MFIPEGEQIKIESKRLNNNENSAFIVFNCSEPKSNSWTIAVKCHIYFDNYFITFKDRSVSKEMDTLSPLPMEW